MKRILIVLTTLACAVQIGCMTTPTGKVTIDPDKLALSLHGVAQLVVTGVVQKNPDLRAYFKDGVVALTLAIDAGKVTPEEINAAIANDVKDPTVVAAIKLAVNQYQLYAGDIVGGGISRNELLKKLLVGLRDGIAEAIGYKGVPSGAHINKVNFRFEYVGKFLRRDGSCPGSDLWRPGFDVAAYMAETTTSGDAFMVNGKLVEILDESAKIAGRLCEQDDLPKWYDVGPYDLAVSTEETGTPITSGGTDAVSLGNTVFATPTSGGCAAPSFRTLSATFICGHGELSWAMPEWSIPEIAALSYHELVRH